MSTHKSGCPTKNSCNGLQPKIQIFKKIAVPVPQTVARRALRRRPVHPEMVKLAAHRPQSLAYLGHRIASAQYPEQHRKKMCPGLE